MASMHPPPGGARREPEYHTGGTFPRDDSSSFRQAVIVPMALSGAIFLVIYLVWAVTTAPKQPEKTPEQIQQEQLRYQYERGQRMQSYLRGVIGAPPIHQQPKPERQP